MIGDADYERLILKSVVFFNAMLCRLFLTVIKSYFIFKFLKQCKTKGMYKIEDPGYFTQ